MKIVGRSGLEQGKHSGGIIGIANLAMEIERNGDDSRLNLDYEFPCGVGITTNPESGLLRPFRYILTTGKPLGKIVYLFYREGSEYYVLGTLAKTKRLLFFPGGDSGQMVDLQFAKTIHIDHFTLEPNCNQWHVTFKEKPSGIRDSSKKTWRINDNLILWFVIQARSINDFERMPSRIQTSLIHKESEIERRSREILLARDGAEFRICEVNDHLQKPYVINFEFFVSRTNKIDFANIPIYYNKPDNKLPDARSLIPNRVHALILPQFF